MTSPHITQKLVSPPKVAHTVRKSLRGTDNKIIRCPGKHDIIYFFIFFTMAWIVTNDEVIHPIVHTFSTFLKDLIMFKESQGQ